MLLSILFGLMVGLSLGLTGGGGAVIAVPLLVYGLGIPPREAVAVSLAAVGAMSVVGFLHRWMLGEVETRTGLLFAVAGMVGAPLGTWLAGFLSDAVLLLAFGTLMVVVAVRMWRQASKPQETQAPAPLLEEVGGPTCRRDTTHSLVLTTRCAALLLTVGVSTGVLSGLFGVGGGFIIVPALVLFSGMAIHRAVGTSLMVIALVSASGVATQIWSGQAIPLGITALFVLAGIGGLFLGQQIARRISRAVLQKVFVVVLLGVAAFVMVRNLLG
ncbi:MAG: sulfite exporter TauE/SafE family protein [Pirellulaceae bacterium]